MLNLTDDEREKMIQEEYPQFEFERYNISEDKTDKFFFENGGKWTYYDIPDFALGCIDDCTFPPPFEIGGKILQNYKEVEEWKNRHYVDSATDTNIRWRIKKKTK